MTHTYTAYMYRHIHTLSDAQLYESKNEGGRTTAGKTERNGLREREGDHV